MIQPSTIHLVSALIGAFALLTVALAVFLPCARKLREMPCTRVDRDEEKLSSLAARIPVSEIGDDLIVRRDGSFCAGWEVQGVATGFAAAQRLEDFSSALDAFIKGVRHPAIELQFRYLVENGIPDLLAERKASAANCLNSAGAWLEENRQSFWKSSSNAGQFRSVRLFVLLSWRPSRTWETYSPITRFATSVWQGLVREGVVKLPAVLRNAAEQARTKAFVKRNRAEHSRCVAEFNQVLETYRIGLGAITKIRRLTEPELAGLLYSSLNPGAARTAKSSSGKLPSLLNTDWSEGLRFLDLGGVLKAVVTLSELPEATFPSLARPLLSLNFPCEVIVSLRVPDQAAKVRKLRTLLKKSLAFQLRKDGSRRRDFQAAAVEKDTVETLTSAVTSSQKLVELEMAVIVSTSRAARNAAEREESERELAQRAEAVVHALGQMNGARGYREHTALLPTFISFLPGVQGVRKTKRDFTLLSGQAADLVPLECPWLGTQDGTPAFLAGTREGTLLRFNPFSPELANANILVTGKTGSGKSFLIKQLLLQLQVLNPRIAIVTKGADYRALVELLGGQYREIGLRTEFVKNPWDFDGDAKAPDSAQIAAVAALAFHMAGRTGSDDAVTLNFLEKAVRMTYDRLLAIGKTPRFSDLKWTLEHYPFENALIEELAHLLALKLNRWTGEGVYAQLFDRDTSPELERPAEIISYDIDGLKESPELQTAVAFTIARTIDQQIGRKDASGSLRPTVAVFDEVWAMLADPVLGAQILNAFRTARKRYGSIIAASQGIEDFVGTAESPQSIGLAILRNTEAKFLCSQLGDLSRLRDVLHLTEPAVEAVKELRNVPGHFAESYLLVGDQAESSAVLQLTATPFDYWATTSHPVEMEFRRKFAREHPELSALEAIYRLGLAYPQGLAFSTDKNRRGNMRKLHGKSAVVGLTLALVLLVPLGANAIFGTIPVVDWTAVARIGEQIGISQETLNRLGLYVDEYNRINEGVHQGIALVRGRQLRGILQQAAVGQLPEFQQLERDFRNVLVDPATLRRDLEESFGLVSGNMALSRKRRIDAADATAVLGLLDSARMELVSEQEELDASDIETMAAVASQGGAAKLSAAANGALLRSQAYDHRLLARLIRLQALAIARENSFEKEQEQLRQEQVTAVSKMVGSMQLSYGIGDTVRP